MLRPVSTATTLVLALAFLSAGAALPLDAAGEPMANGKHYTLNLLGKEKIGGADYSGGNRIFVPLDGECRIDLSEGAFDVVEGNCVADGRAAFQLPNPDPENDGFSSYRIYVRALGKPDGSAVFNTCREDSDGTWCSTENVYVVRAGGHSPSYDASRELLTVCHDKDGDGTYEREQIFDDGNADYFWKYQNSGLRLAQLRFYPDTPTDISGPCPGV